MLSFTKQPSGNVLSFNPILFEVKSDYQKSISFFVRVSKGIGYEIVFQGQLFPEVNNESGEYYYRANVADILQSYFPVPSVNEISGFISKVDNFSRDFRVSFHGENYESLEYSGKFYPGGISKKMFRYLSERKTDIFSYRFFNKTTPIFLTTRTSKNEIEIKESEISPLYFYASNNQYSLMTEFGNIFILPDLLSENLYMLNIDAIRKSSEDQYGKIPFQLTILIDGSPNCEIHIKEKFKIPHRFIIEFLNSFSVFEKIEITGKSIFNPELDAESAYMSYDQGIDDYIEKNSRIELKEVIKAESGYKTNKEFFFIRDMLQSNKKYLINESGSKMEVSVISDGFSHEVWPITPGSIPLSIQGIESDSNFYPEIPLSLNITDYLTDNFNVGITDNPGVPFELLNGVIISHTENRKELKAADRLLVENSDTKNSEWISIDAIKNLIK